MWCSALPGSAGVPKCLAASWNSMVQSAQARSSSGCSCGVHGWVSVGSSGESASMPAPREGGVAVGLRNGREEEGPRPRRLVQSCPAIQLSPKLFLDFLQLRYFASHLPVHTLDHSANSFHRLQFGVLFDPVQAVIGSCDPDP